MTDFFERQEKARKNTVSLLVMFVFCIIGVVVSVTLLSWGLLISGGLALQLFEELLMAIGRSADIDLGNERLFTTYLLTDVPWKWLAGTATGTFLGIIFCCWIRSRELKVHGNIVATDLGGRLLGPRNSTLKEKRLLNVVSEMALASGTPIPEVYLLDGEDGINAFAAGMKPSQAVIGVTRGSLEKLTRAELQGIVAHEFSHILAGDMKLNTRLISWIYGLIAVWIVGQGLLGNLGYVQRNRFGYRERAGGSFIWLFTALFALGLIVVGSIGVLFARLLQAAILRQREFLADASAVQFTRDPIGIAGALKKAAKDKIRIHSPHEEEVAHLLFSDNRLFTFGLRTHPPLRVRIKRLQKNWDGEIPGELASSDTGNLFYTEESGTLMNFQEGKNLGSPKNINLAVGTLILDGLKKDWLDKLSDELQARAMVFALLLRGQNSEMRRKHQSLKQHMLGDFPRMVHQWEEQLAGLHSARKIALIEFALPALKELSEEKCRLFLDTIWELIRGDGQIDLFEFMLQRMIKRQLDIQSEEAFGGRKKVVPISELEDEFALLLSAFASLDSNSDAAYQSGVAKLKMRGSRIAKEEISLTQLDPALRKIEQALPLAKRSFLQACLRVVTYDGVLTSSEAEMLRLMTDSIGCAMPPFNCEIGELA